MNLLVEPIKIAEGRAQEGKQKVEAGQKTKGGNKKEGAGNGKVSVSRPCGRS